jgi:anthranilate/para-aminobenzoate synthase component II
MIATVLCCRRGPGHPDEYDNLWLRDWLMANPQMPTFGICLGLQILLHWSGIRISQIAEVPVHGRIAPLARTPETITLPEPFASIAPQSQVVWYNSLGASWDDFLAHGSSSWLAVPCDSYAGFVSLACHRALPWCGVQFHPESFATPAGTDFFAAFLKLCAANRVKRKR